MKTFLLLGKDIDYSFSPKYFNHFFEENELKIHHYGLKSLRNQDEFLRFISSEGKHIHGLNVTIPYKKIAAQACDILVGNAAITKAVNCMMYRNEKWIGYNTDVYGFSKTLENTEKPIHKAIILGSGGAAEAVMASLNRSKIKFKVVSRSADAGQWNYEDLKSNYVDYKPNLVVNTTPVGTFPNVNQVVDFPFEHLTGKECLIDLIYNPTKTLFLLHGASSGCETHNGLMMLTEQAKLSWHIWNQ